MSILFRKRSLIVRRLLRHRVSHETPRSLEKLTFEQLEDLALAIESRGAEEAPCVLLPAAGEPHFMMCREWRWPDIAVSHELRRLPTCALRQDRLVCCNPYHWSRLYKPDLPPPPYTKIPEEKSEDTITSGYSDQHISQFSGCSEASRPWCKVAYWELSKRVGRLLPVSKSFINVFADLPQGDGLCLQTLADSCPTDNTSILQTRTKIGYGITIFKESDEIWIYNRSDYPVFVNSPTLDPPNTEKLTVFRVQPGYAIKIFDYERARYNQKMKDPSLMKEGPFDPHAVRISFAKGWGSPKYSRRFVTSCPCWLEVMFLVNR